VAFTSVHAGNYRTEDKLKTDTLQKLNKTQKKQTTQNTAKQNNPGLVTSYDTPPGNEVGNAPKPTWGPGTVVLRAERQSAQMSQDAL